MFDVAPTELLLVAVVALVVIGPKDLPRAMHFVGKWVGKARGIARQFRSGLDSMVREAELAEMEKQWAAENERIMRQHPPTPPLPAPIEHDAVPSQALTHDTGLPPDSGFHTEGAPPVMVAKPDLRPDPEAEPMLDLEPRPAVPEPHRDRPLP